jgi:Xaa-Pro aminopeptidase/Xaa-Pro dipeptidase
MPRNRQAKILHHLSNDGFTAAVLFRPENVYYSTGFWGEAVVICTPDSMKLFVPELEVSRAETESKECEVIPTQRGEGVVKSLYPSLSNIKACSDCNDFSLVSAIRAKVDKSNFVCDPEPFLIVRSVKEQDEIGMIVESAHILDKLYQVCIEEIRVGLSERDLQSRLICEATTLGGSLPSYSFTLNPFIVASGSNGSFPHAEISNRCFCEGDLIVVDLTMRYRGYISDATRTFGLGNVSDEKRKVYDIVKTAQRRGLDAARSSVKCRDIDLECRDFISNCGYGENFIHSTGHGVGLDVHERPWIRPEDENVLRENMVITIEPGIYIKSKFGVRIEDTVVINGDGSSTNSVITKFTKDLITI